jgi:hypothetical protein
MMASARCGWRRSAANRTRRRPGSSGDHRACHGQHVRPPQAGLRRGRERAAAPRRSGQRLGWRLADRADLASAARQADAAGRARRGGRDAGPGRAPRGGGGDGTGRPAACAPGRAARRRGQRAGRNRPRCGGHAPAGGRAGAMVDRGVPRRPPGQPPGRAARSRRPPLRRPGRARSPRRRRRAPGELALCGGAERPGHVPGHQEAGSLAARRRARRVAALTPAGPVPE